MAKAFLDFIEIRTKLASVLPFLIGSMYALYRFDVFILSHAALLFCSVIFLDISVTALNNHLDNQKSQSKSAGLFVTALLFAAAFLGVVLVMHTNFIVFVIGIVSFSVGILYSFGPVPFSRLPAGELLSGIFMGFVIPFLAVYVHIYDQDVLTASMADGWFSLHFSIVEMFGLFLISLPVAAPIANLMLANNLCDLDSDWQNGRYTLPQFIGREHAVILFEMLYLLPYIAVLAGVLLAFLPASCVLVLLTVFPVYKNARRFAKEQSKARTFPCAVRNLAWICIAYPFSMMCKIMVD